MSNSKRSRKNNTKHSSTQQDGSPHKSDNNPRSRKRKFNPSHNTHTRCGVDVLSSSKLPKSVRDLIDTVFNGDNDLTKDLIEEPAVRLLEEVTEEEALHAVQEFAERYKVAKHKILRSKAGYFRGVCQKYWKQNREHKKLDLLRKAAINPSPNGKYTRQLSALVSETIESLFTPASGLAVSIIDDSVQRRLTSLTDEQAIEALHEFCSAVMYRQDRIRNMNAYLMNIIKRRTTRPQTSKGESEQTRNKSKTPSQGNDSPQKDSGSEPSGVPRMKVNIPRKGSRSPRSTPSSEQSYEEPLSMKRIRSAGEPRPMMMAGLNDPRLVVSNPHASFDVRPREASPSTPPSWNLAQSAPSLPFMTRHDPDLTMQRGFSDNRFRRAQRPHRLTPPIRNSTPSAEMLGCTTPHSDDDDDSGVVYVDDYGDEEDDIASLSEHSGGRPQLGNAQRPSNGPPIQNPNVPRIMARDSKPVPVMQNSAREEEYKREIRKLKRENEQLQDKMERLEMQMQRLIQRQNQPLPHFESPQLRPAPYYTPQIYGAYTPPTSGSNASTSARSQLYGDGAFPPPNYVPSPQFHPSAMQPPFMGFGYPGIPSNPNIPNIPLYGNLSAPNGLPNAMPPGQFVPSYPYPMGPA